MPPLMQLAAAAAAALGANAPTTSGQSAITLPTVYEAGHFYAVPRTADGKTLRLLIDTGGGGGIGMYWITRPAADRLGLKVRICKAEGEEITVAPVPTFVADRQVPGPVPSRSPCGQVLTVNGDSYQDGDGQLGAGYLPGRVWTFDYPGRRVVAEGSTWQPHAEAHRTPLGFLREKGVPVSGFPRITVQVEGEAIDLLFDTGATSHPTALGKAATGDSTVRGQGVTSYITHSQFERWRTAHPGWRVVDKGDDLLGPEHPIRIIEVPKLTVAGWTVGPVWFTERPDGSFHNFMAQWMDKRPEGALGANVFRHFVVTVDYPRSTAWFRCVQGCAAGGRW